MVGSPEIPFPLETERPSPEEATLLEAKVLMPVLASIPVAAPFKLANAPVKFTVRAA
jgi:hypothetical protein